MTREELAQVIADAESDHLGIKRQKRAFGDAEHDIYIRAAAAVLAHLGEGREREKTEIDKKFAVYEASDAMANRRIRELNAQAAAHGDSIRQVQVRMVKLEARVRDLSSALVSASVDVHFRHRSGIDSMAECRNRLCMEWNATLDAAVALLAETDGRSTPATP